MARLRVGAQPRHVEWKLPSAVVRCELQRAHVLNLDLSDDVKRTFFAEA